MPENIDIEVRVEQLAQQINQDPEAFAAALQGIADSMYADKPEYKPLALALKQVAVSAGVVASYAE
jgi:hypothetical protein